MHRNSVRSPEAGSVSFIQTQATMKKCSKATSAGNIYCSRNCRANAVLTRRFGFSYYHKSCSAGLKNRLLAGIFGYTITIAPNPRIIRCSKQPHREYEYCSRIFCSGHIKNAKMAYGFTEWILLSLLIFLNKPDTAAQFFCSGSSSTWKSCASANGWKKR